MKSMSYTESRARYAEVLDGVINDREEVVITRAGHEPVVIVSLEDYESLKEAAYLMRSPGQRSSSPRRHGATRIWLRPSPRSRGGPTYLPPVRMRTPWRDDSVVAGPGPQGRSATRHPPRPHHPTVTRASASPIAPGRWLRRITEGHAFVYKIVGMRCVSPLVATTTMNGSATRYLIQVHPDGFGRGRPRRDPRSGPQVGRCGL